MHHLIGYLTSHLPRRATPDTPNWWSFSALSWSCFCCS